MNQYINTPHKINMVDDEDELLSYYFTQNDYERRPSTSSTTSTSSTCSTSSSSRRSFSSLFVSSTRQPIRLSTLFNRRRSSSSLSCHSTSSSSFTRFSLPSLSPSGSSCTVVCDEPLSPKQMEIEQLIADYPERTVRLSVTPEFAI